jgi:hypothetical protein
MALTTLAQIEQAPKQYLVLNGSTSSISPLSTFAALSIPSGGVLAGGQASPPSNAVGAVPTQATAGYPTIRAFPAGATGYISKATIAVQPFGIGGFAGPSFIHLFDRVFCAGPYPFDANIQLSGSPSFAARLPRILGTANPDYTSAEVWAEVVTAMTGALALDFRYTNEIGTTGVQGPVTSFATGAGIRRALKLPYAAGSKGVQAVERVNGATATAGTFNICVMRRLMTLAVPGVDKPEIIYGPESTGLPIISQDAAICGIVTGSATHQYEIELEVAMG